MEKDIELMELLYELTEEHNRDLVEENEDLRRQNIAMAAYIQYLQDKNKDLVNDYNSLIDINRRLN